MASMVYAIWDHWLSAKPFYSPGDIWWHCLQLGGTGYILVITLGKEERMPLASGEWRPGMPLNTLQCTGQPLTTKNEPVQMSIVLWFKKASSRGQEFPPRKFKFQKPISYCRHQKTSWRRRQKIINGNSFLRKRATFPSFLCPCFWEQSVPRFCQGPPSFGPHSRRPSQELGFLLLSIYTLPHHLALPGSERLFSPFKNISHLQNNINTCWVYTDVNK